MKIDTKTKIVLGAVELYNEHGFSNVSFLKIAERLSLSPGNLTYHYPKKDDLMSAIYLYFQAELMKSLPLEVTAITLSSLHDQMAGFFTLQKNLKFFYSDLVDIVRAYPKIGEQHTQHIDNQISRMQAVITELVRTGHVNESKSPDTYLLLSHQLWQTASFWLSRCIVRGMNHDLAEFREYSWSLVYPHLTDIGKTELAALINIQKFT
jgi:AcrR family transcriptional regulator